MKILYVVPRFPTASETFVAEEVIGVRARGHTVTAVALARPTPDQLTKMGPRIRALANETVYLSRIPLVPLAAVASIKHDIRVLNRRLSEEASLKTHASLRHLRAAAVATLARRIGAEIIYAHWPRPTEVALLAGIMAGLPVAMSVHAHEVAHDNGHFLVAFEQVSFGAFCNAAAMNYLLERLPQNARKKAHLVYHGVDFAQFSRRELPIYDGTLKIVTAGRLTATKGIDRLLRAVSLARNRGIAITLTVIGDGSQRKELEDLTTSLNLGKWVRFVGWVPHEKMSEQLRAAHVFALMANNNFHDGLPNVVLEAMALGRPVIISPLPAAPEAVLHGRNGYILAQVDALEEFVNCCAALIQSPERLLNWSQVASETVRTQHDRAMQLDRLCNLFTQMRTSQNVNRYE